MSKKARKVKKKPQPKTFSELCQEMLGNLTLIDSGAMPKASVSGLGKLKGNHEEAVIDKVSKYVAGTSISKVRHPWQAWLGVFTLLADGTLEVEGRILTSPSKVLLSEFDARFKTELTTLVDDTHAELNDAGTKHTVGWGTVISSDADVDLDVSEEDLIDYFISIGVTDRKKIDECAALRKAG